MTPQSSENLVQLKDARLARFLDSAAESHRTGNYPTCLLTLEKASLLLEPDKNDVLIFLTSWRDAVEKERRGLPLLAPPAAWGTVAREISARVEKNQSYNDCLSQKTTSHRPRRRLAQRLSLAVLGTLSFMLGFTVVAFVLRGFISQFDDGYRFAQLPFFRQGAWLYFHAFATMVWGLTMAVYGFRWIHFACESRSILKPKVALRPVDNK